MTAATLFKLKLCADVLVALLERLDLSVADSVTLASMLVAKSLNLGEYSTLL